MAVTTIKHPFDPNQVDNVAVETLFTANSATGAVTKGRVKFANTTAGAVTISCYAVPSGGTAGDTNAIAKTYSVPANDYVEFDYSLGAGGFLQAQAGAATSITASSVMSIEYLP